MMAGRRIALGVAGMAVLVILIWAWIQGGEQDLQDISMPVELPAATTAAATADAGMVSENGQ